MKKKFAFVPLFFSSFVYGSLLQDRQAFKAYSNGKIEVAQNILQKQQVEDPYNAQINYNLGVTHYKANNFNEASKSFERVIQKGTDASQELKEKAYFNWGNVLYKKGVSALGKDWETKDLQSSLLEGVTADILAAIQKYENTLVLNKNNDKAPVNKKNAESLLKKLQAKKHQQDHQQRQQNNANNEKQKEDKQNQDHGNRKQDQQKGTSGQDDRREKNQEKQNDNKQKGDEKSQPENAQPSSKNQDEQKKDHQQKDHQQKKEHEKRDAKSDPLNNEQRDLNKKEKSEHQQGDSTKDEQNSAHQKDKERANQQEGKQKASQEQGSQEKVEKDQQSQLLASADKKNEKQPQSMQQRGMKVLLDDLAAQESNLQKEIIARRTKGQQPYMSQGQNPW